MWTPPPLVLDARTNLVHGPTGTIRVSQTRIMVLAKLNREWPNPVPAKDLANFIHPRLPLHQCPRSKAAYWALDWLQTNLGRIGVFITPGPWGWSFELVQAREAA